MELVTNWIQAFLTGRTQRVIIDNALSISSYIDVSSGVIQGSVLGPLIFLLFIEDIFDCLVSDDVDPTSCCIFADDLKLYSSYNVNSDNSSLSNSMRNIENWSIQWQLLINPDKCMLLQVGKMLQTRREYFICNKRILPSGVIRDYDITYNSKLDFHDYIDEIVSKAFQRINLLFRSFISGNISILTRAVIIYVICETTC